MPKRVLDTNILINYWGRASKDTPRHKLDDKKAAKWARMLIEHHDSNSIVAPVYIEYVAGKKSKEDVNLARAFLAHFEIIDDWRILSEDWHYARRLAERVPRHGFRRQLGDCLIRAICKRLNFEVITADKHFHD